MTTRSHPAGLEEQVVEVKDLVQRTLEKQGLLDHVRAILRSAVFVAIDHENEDLQLLHPNPKVASISKTHSSRVALELVREFLEFYDLRQTLSVFVPETHTEAGVGLDRQGLQAAVGFKLDPTTSVIEQLLDRGAPGSPATNGSTSPEAPHHFPPSDLPTHKPQAKEPSSFTPSQAKPTAGYMNQAKDTAGYMGQSLGSTSHRGFSAYDDDDDLQHEEGEGDKRGAYGGVDVDLEEEEEVSDAEALFIARTRHAAFEATPPPAPVDSSLPLPPSSRVPSLSGLPPLKQQPPRRGSSAEIDDLLGHSDSEDDEVRPPPPPATHKDEGLGVRGFSTATHLHHDEEEEEDEEEGSVEFNGDVLLDDDEEDDVVQLRQGPSSAPTTRAWGQPPPRNLPQDSGSEDDSPARGKVTGRSDEDSEEEEGVVLRPRATGFQSAAVSSRSSRPPKAPTPPHDDEEEEDEIEYGGDFESDAEFDDVEELSASEDLSPRLEDSTAHEQHNKRNAADESGSLEASVVDHSVGGSSVLDHEVDFAEPVLPPRRR